MNHNAPASHGESWPADSKDEIPTPKKKRRNRRSGKRKSRTASVSIKSAEFNPDRPREYSAKKLSEAVIWARDADRLGDDNRPLIPNERQPAQYATEAEQVQVIDHSEDADRVRAEVTPPIVSQQNALQSAPAKEREWAAFDHPQRADHEPPRTQERQYFWNQADVYSSGDHDMLPSVAGDQAAQGELTQTSVRRQEMPVVAALDNAVNPNLPQDTFPMGNNSEKVSAQNEHDETRSKAEIMSRRSNKRAVQSQEMEAKPLQPAAAEAFSGDRQYAEEVVATNDEPGPDADVLPTEPIATGMPPEAAPPLTSLDDLLAEHLPGPSPAENMEYAPGKLERPGSEVEQSVQGTVEHSMQRSELLDLARTIRVDGVSVYEIFTARRIDEEGLRRIIVAYLRGDELRQLITNEVIRQQMRFERDPHLRDMPVNAADRQKAKPGATKKFKDRTKSILDKDRAKDRTIRVAEITQDILERSHEYLHENPKAGRNFGIIAIVIIYFAILIIALMR